MKHHQLNALVAVADQGSFHGAARALHLTQPAITKAIKDLEAELGVLLVTRQARGVELTTEGKTLLVRARLIVRELRRAREDIGQLKGNRDGKLTIGVTPLAGLTIVPRAFAQFRAAWPKVKVDFIEYTSDQLFVQLRSGGLDFAVGVTTGGTDKTPVHQEELLSLPTALTVHRNSPLARCQSLAELRHAEWLHTDLTERFPIFLAELFAREGLEPPLRVTRCTSQALFHSLAMTNDVVFFWSLYAISMPELRKRFMALPLSIDLPRITIKLLFREDSLLTSAAAYFVRCIRDITDSEWAAL
ncbi:LysR substrate-binding domain-containing protein [Burkholderia ubonensis]|uniref:LysR substrate-binding domain-containing protein n=1 Tax=Burkholderia ubonensis TaxID=101571 RepID=UPI0007590305|nr:LysR substrate-binding domain-containing protein [Burkholderia ubonensis]KWO52324.1 hypothetical protein WM30_24545 [Burkholderia ubonensis]